MEQEIDSLPGKYALPFGCILLARVQGNLAGCVALRKLNDQSAEMKRFYVRDSFRGNGVGHALVKEVTEEARRKGYSSIQLGTHPSLTGAMKIYAKLGFRPIKTDFENYLPGSIFMGLPLTKQEKSEEKNKSPFDRMSPADSIEIVYGMDENKQDGQEQSR